MPKQQCQTCKQWFEDEAFDAHLQQHLIGPAEEGKARDRPRLKCPVCAGTEFDKESGFVKESFRYSGHNIVLAVCRRCHFVLQFYSGKTIFGVWGEKDSNYSEIRDMLDSGKIPP